jgi:hypothetical protein
MTVTIQGLKHTEIKRDRTDPRFAGRTLRIISEFGGELNIELSARQVVSLASLLNEAKSTLVHKNHQWMNADEATPLPTQEPNPIIERLGEEIRSHVYIELINHTTIERHAAMGIAISTKGKFVADCEAELIRLATPAVF